MKRLSLLLICLILLGACQTFNGKLQALESQTTIVHVTKQAGWECSHKYKFFLATACATNLKFWPNDVLTIPKKYDKVIIVDLGDSEWLSKLKKKINKEGEYLVHFGEVNKPIGEIYISPDLDLLHHELGHIATGDWHNEFT